MNPIQVKLAALWIVLLFIYIYGDILRILSGDTMPGNVKVDDKKFSSKMWFGIAVMMLIPISMIFLSLELPHNINRWANIVIAGFWLVLNVPNIHTYKGAYDKFLLAVSAIINIITIWYAWGW